jgi:hypothetical protein
MIEGLLIFMAVLLVWSSRRQETIQVNYDDTEIFARIESIERRIWAIEHQLSKIRYELTPITGE